MLHRNIIVVKKIIDGKLCKKCRIIDSYMYKNDVVRHVKDTYFITDNDIPHFGHILSNHYRVKTSPFFVVYDKDPLNGKAYKYYFDFLYKEITPNLEIKE